MTRLILSATGTLLLTFAQPAVAQNGAMWIDNIGRMMSLGFAGGDGAPPATFDRTSSDMAMLFKKVCLDTHGDPSRLGSGQELAKIGLSAEPFTIPGTKKMAATTLNIWRGRGAVISQTAGFFAARVAQCNVTFYLNSLPQKQDVVEAVTAGIGVGPANADKATKNNGKPNNSYVPEWAVTLDGVPHVVVAHVAQGYPSMPGDRVQIAVRALTKAK